MATVAKVKGTGMVHVVKALRVRRDHVAPLLPDPLRGYLQEKILSASWYPTADLMALLTTMVHFVPKGVPEPWWWMGQQSANADLAEVYGAMVQRGNAWATLQRLPRLWRLYHDGGRMEVGVAGATKAQVMLYDFAFAGEEFCTLINGYLDAMARLAGTPSEVKTLQTGHRLARWLIAW